jgi:hypothetical protein
MLIELEDNAMGDGVLLESEDIEPDDPDVEDEECYTPPCGEVAVEYFVSLN